MVVELGRVRRFDACCYSVLHSIIHLFSSFLFVFLGILFLNTPVFAQTVNYTYDTGTNGIGRLSSVTDPTGSTTFSYDVRGNVTQTVKVIEGDSFTVQNSYDSLGRVVTITYPDTPNPEVVTYTYDPAGNLQTVTSPATSYVTDIKYNAFNQRTKITFGNNVSTTYSYDPNSFRLSQICTRLTLPCSDPATTPAVLENLSYTYDNGGNVLSITDLVNATYSQTFTYDEINRLNTATSASSYYGSLTYKYDPIGNIRCNPQVSACTNGSGGYQDNYFYPPSGIASVRPHAVTQAGSNSYGYDNNGNMTSGAGRTITYDKENRPTNIVNSITGKTIDMAYDYKGNRVKRTVGTEITYYMGDIYEKKGSAIEKYVFAGSTRVALKNASGSTYFYHSDHLGSTHLMTNATGGKEDEVHYSPFGATSSDSGPVFVKHKYTGQELDSDAQLYYYKARFYDAVLGRFISADTIGIHLSNPQSLNRYSYAINDPLKYTDPTGHDIDAAGNIVQIVDSQLIIVGGKDSDFYNQIYTAQWSPNTGQVVQGWTQNTGNVNAWYDATIAEALQRGWNGGDINVLYRGGAGTSGSGDVINGWGDRWNRDGQPTFVLNAQQERTGGSLSRMASGDGSGVNLLGHSLGGAAAVATARDNPDLRFNNMVTIDSVCLWGCNQIPSNVNRNDNFYQTEWWFPHGGENFRTDRQNGTVINNHDVSGFGVNHFNLVNSGSVSGHGTLIGGRLLP